MREYNLTFLQSYYQKATLASSQKQKRIKNVSCHQLPEHYKNHLKKFSSILINKRAQKRIKNTRLLIDLHNKLFGLQNMKKIVKNVLL